MQDRLRRLRRNLLVAASGCALAGSGARAAPEGPVIAHQGTGSGAPPCVACHGASGEGNPAMNAPRLAGLGASYLEEQLSAFADGKRANPTMTSVAKALKPDQRQAVAAYYSGLAAPPAPAPAPVPAGAWLATRGRWAENLPACDACHGPNGVGVGAAFPPLAGLPAAYTEEQLQAWRTGARPAGPLGLMGAVAARLSPGDIKAVAAYFAGQPAAAPQQAEK